jgi:hypothetical protein
MSVTLSEVKRAARAHRAPLAGESAGYLVLAIADQVLKAPRLVQVADIQLNEDGALHLASGQASSDVDAELSLRRALDQLLLVASTGSAALTRASRRTEPLGLSSLVRELEAALIPVNRSAARRALSRVHRETARALESGSLPEDEDPRAPEPVRAPAAALPVVPAAVPMPAPPVFATPAPLPAIALPTPPPAIALPAPLPAVALPASAPAVATPSPPPTIALPAPLPAVALPAPLSVVALASISEPELASDDDQDLETPALTVPVQMIAMESHLDGVISALCEQLPSPPQFVETDALASALAVRAVSTIVSAPVAVTEPEPEFLLDIDVEYETDAVDSSAAPTVMRAVQVEPVPLSVHDASSDSSALDMPPEALTRPEPVVLRRTLRPLLEPLSKALCESEPPPQTLEVSSDASSQSEPLVLELSSDAPSESEPLVLELSSDAPSESEPRVLELSSDLPSESEPLVLELSSDAPSESEPLVFELSSDASSQSEPLVLELSSDVPSEGEPLLQTPTLGSLATELPILAPEEIAEMTLVARILHSSQLRDERTERISEVPPLSPGVAIVETKKSDVSELVSSFRVSEPSVSPGLCRAIKEMADLDLTPGPFAALIRER